MRWPNFESLRRALVTGNFRPELVALPGGLVPPERPLPPPTAPRRQALETLHPEEGTTPTAQAQGSRRNQEQEQNPYPAPQMQIGPGFRIRTAIYKAASNGVNIPQTENGRHCFLLYHIKGACNTHFGGRHLHIPLSKKEFGRLGKWRNRYFGREEAPLLREVNIGGRIQASTLSA